MKRSAPPPIGGAMRAVRCGTSAATRRRNALPTTGAGTTIVDAGATALGFSRTVRGPTEGGHYVRIEIARKPPRDTVTVAGVARRSVSSRSTACPGDGPATAGDGTLVRTRPHAWCCRVRSARRRPRAPIRFARDELRSRPPLQLGVRFQPPPAFDSRRVPRAPRARQECTTTSPFARHARRSRRSSRRQWDVRNP